VHPERHGPEGAPAPGSPRHPPPPPPSARRVPLPPPPPAPEPAAGGAALAPTTSSEREPILDALRGVAVLGILPINVQLMRGPEFWASMAAAPAPVVEVAASTTDRVAAGLLGLLVAGKFLASFALLFGVGAAIIVGRALARGQRPRAVLARRYAWLLPLGLLHMLLLFPGDLLFLYGLSGLALLAFVDVRSRTAWWWGVGLVVGVTVLTVGISLLVALFAVGSDVPADDPFAAGMADFGGRRAEQAVAAFTEGGYLDVVVANAWQALVLQGSQLFLLPYVLGLFLIGFAVGRAGWVADLAAHRPQLRRVAIAGILVGLPLNVGPALLGPLGIDGPAGVDPSATPPALGVLSALGQTLGAPILAAGYLAALALWWSRRGRTPRPLTALGRVALSAYLLQSVLALVVFAGSSLYGRLGTASSLVVVVGIWVVLLVVAPLWVSRVGQGPVERLWRRLTYGASREGTGGVSTTSRG
jgi:uncharacterized protein